MVIEIRDGEQQNYCCECNISFGLAEKRWPIGGRGVAHKDCHDKYMRKHGQQLELQLQPSATR